MPDLLVPAAYRWCPPWSQTFGPEVVDLAASFGLVLDANQAMSLDDMFSVRPGSSSEWNVIEDATVCDRQNLKTVQLEAAAAAKLALFGDDLVVWTAHEYPTSVEAFRDIKPWFTDYDHMSRLVKQVFDGKGDESIELMSGARMIFRARTKHGGRGISGDTVILDEAQKLTAANMGALVPTISARQRSHLLYGGTAGDQQAHVWRRLRDRGRAGHQPRMAYREWCAPWEPCEQLDCTHIEDEGCALDREHLIQAANPSLGIPGRLRYEVIQTERQTMPAAEFMRERLGWWDDPPEGGGAFDIDVWLALGDPGVAQGDRVEFAVTTAPDRSWAAVGAAWIRPDGHTQVSLVDYRQNTTWVEARVAELKAQPVLDTASRGLVDGTEITLQQQAQAHNALSDAVTASAVFHDNLPALNMSIRLSAWRPMGDTRILDAKTAGDISPLRAVAHAAWAVNRPRPSGGWMVSL